MKENTKKLTLEQKHQQKLKRRQILRAALAALLALIFIATMVSPLFALSPKEEETIDEIIEVLRNRYYKEIDRDEMMIRVYKSLLESLDPHSTYLTPQEYDKWAESLNGNFFGIGAYLGQDDRSRLRIESVISGTPAEKSGLRGGDVIEAIDGKPTEGMSTEAAVPLIRGPKGTTVVLRILRGDRRLEVSIVRDEIRIKAVEYKVLPTGEGYIKLSEFSEGSSAEMRAAVTALEKQGIERLVVDLRGNGGGYLREAVAISDLFVGKDKVIVKTAGAHEEESVYRARLTRTPMKVAVLIDPWSASASEILAGAIQQNEEGIIVGKTSFGKGTVQMMFRLSEAGFVKITVAEYLLAGDVKVHGVGIVPDYEADDLSALSVACDALKNEQ